MPEPNFPPDVLPENSPDQPGTIFPALDRSSPGDGGQQSADITSNPLEPMVSDDPAIKEAIQFSPGATPSGDALLPMGEPVQVAGAEIDAPQKRKPRTYQDRINRLTRNYRGAQEKNVELEGQIGDLTQAIIQLQNKNSAPAQQPVPAPAGDAASVFASPGESGGTETPPAAGRAGQPMLTADEIAGIVRREIHSYDQEVVQRNSAVSDLVKKQEESYAEAVEEFPELNDPKSAAQRTFREVYATSPLRELPDAPYQIALQVKGILSAGAVADAGKATRKQQAAVVVPQASQGGDGSGANTSALRKEFAQLSHTMKQGNNDYRVYKRWRLIRNELSRAQSQT